MAIDPVTGKVLGEVAGAAARSALKGMTCDQCGRLHAPAWFSGGGTRLKCCSKLLCRDCTSAWCQAWRMNGHVCKDCGADRPDA